MRSLCNGTEDRYRYEIHSLPSETLEKYSELFLVDRPGSHNERSQLAFKANGRREFRVVHLQVPLFHGGSPFERGSTFGLDADWSIGAADTVARAKGGQCDQSSQGRCRRFLSETVSADLATTATQ